MKRFAGFTLIELLIVVAIIAILAAIAVPNFLEAQTRAKISRVKGDLRTLGTAIEMYRIDNNHCPCDYNVTQGDPQAPGMQSYTSGICHPGAVIGGKIHAGLTTPLAYVNDCWLKDPFLPKNAITQQIDFDQAVYTYNPMVKLWGRTPNSQYTTNKYEEFYGEYRLGSIGPDKDWYNGGTFGSRKHSICYDATNGTVSIGNIWRSLKEPDVTNRPLADRNLP